MEARMLLLQDPHPTTDAAHYRHVLLTTPPDRNQRRVTLTTTLDSDHNDRDEAEDRPRRC